VRLAPELSADCSWIDFDRFPPRCLTPRLYDAMRQRRSDCDSPTAVERNTQIEAWRALLPVHAAEEADRVPALEAVRDHGLKFWDAML
jgi:hypothetical protein